MPTLTIPVPPEHRDDVLRELLSFYASSAAALGDAADEYLRREHSPRILLVRRGELARLDALLKQVGWHLNGPPRPARLTGEIDLISEIGRRVLGNAIEDMTDALSETGTGPQDIEAVGRTLRRVSSLYELIHEAYRTRDRRVVEAQCPG